MTIIGDDTDTHILLNKIDEANTVHSIWSSNFKNEVLVMEKKFGF